MVDVYCHSITVDRSVMGFRGMLIKMVLIVPECKEKTRLKGAPQLCLNRGWQS